MTDTAQEALVERLRRSFTYGYVPRVIREELAEAADKLDALRAELAAVKAKGDALAEELARSCDGWGNVVELGLVPPQHMHTAIVLANSADETLRAYEAFKAEECE